MGGTQNEVEGGGRNAGREGREKVEVMRRGRGNGGVPHVRHAASAHAGRDGQGAREKLQTESEIRKEIGDEVEVWRRKAVREAGEKAERDKGRQRSTHSAHSQHACRGEDGLGGGEGQ